MSRYLRKAGVAIGGVVGVDALPGGAQLARHGGEAGLAAGQLGGGIAAELEEGDGGIEEDVLGGEAGEEALEGGRLQIGGEDAALALGAGQPVEVGFVGGEDESGCGDRTLPSWRCRR